MKWRASWALASHCRSLLRSYARQPISLQTIKKLHALLISSSLISTPNTFLRNALLQAYASFPDPHYAHKVFDEIPHSQKDTVDWTTLISCFLRTNLPVESLHLFLCMHRLQVESDDVTLVCLFNACARLGDSGIGALGHGLMKKMGFGSSVKACNALMDVYVKCRMVSAAKRVFEEMSDPSVVSYTVILEGVVKQEGLGEGRSFFDTMPERNEIAWTMIIVAYEEQGCTMESFNLLAEMIFEFGMIPNHVTLCSLLSACTQSLDVSMGKWVHVHATKHIISSNRIMIDTALVDMYAKCGRITIAINVFNHMKNRNVVTWNALLSGLAVHGQIQTLLSMFSRMIHDVKPDDITLTAVLSGCSHAGLVDQGRYYFRNLEFLYGIRPKMEHYGCMVDILGRAGLLNEAEALIKCMPFPPNEFVLGSLMASCNVRGKLQLGQRVLRELIEMDAQNTEYHVLVSNMFSLAGKQDQANTIRRGIRKLPGVSSIQVNGHIHRFFAGDKTHPETDSLYKKLDEVIKKLRLFGYVPNTYSQSFSGIGECDVSEIEEKEQAVMYHSEKLAVCFGLMRMKTGVRIYVFKNLRVCLDCHSALKIMSSVYDREIVVRDRIRFHSFKGGFCSCSDYW